MNVTKRKFYEIAGTMENVKSYEIIATCGYIYLEDGTKLVYDIIDLTEYEVRMGL